MKLNKVADYAQKPALIAGHSLHVIAFINAIILLFFDKGNFASHYGAIIEMYTYTTVLFTAANIFFNFVTKKFKINVLRMYSIDFVVLLLFLISGDFKGFFIYYILARQMVIIIKKITLTSWEGIIYDTLTKNPATFFMLSFVFVISIGSVLLMLPMSTDVSVDPANHTSFLGALFTSTSATCVTGLIVYDTGTHFTLFGQLIILILIQIGGLGVMTISTAFAILLGQRMTVKSESLMQNVIGESNRLDMQSLVKNILFVTVSIELVGAVFLYLKFYPTAPSTFQAVYQAVFHSVSAFCNAGFSLYSDSFTMYRSSWLLNITVMMLIIFGGIGFSVLSDVRKNVLVRYNPARLTLHSKLVLWTSAILIVLGFVVYFVTEFNGIMADYSMNDRILSSLFQSVSTRTAGFNTIDNGDFSHASVLISLLLMLVGASPGSTGGGIKTTTLAVLFLTAWAMMHSKKNVYAFRKGISTDTIRKVVVLIALTLGFIMFMSCLFFYAEDYNTKYPDMGFAELMFELISAFGTVGLSMGITNKLTIVGKLIIIILMFLGRIGPLTLIFAMSGNKKGAALKYTDEKVGIG